MDSVLVSVIIPTFNRAQYIGEAIDSIIAQTYTNWECIIVDDGCTDNTAEILQDYTKRDSRIKYVVRPEQFKKGSNGSRNYGVTVSQGKLIAFNDDDDIWLPEKLEQQVPIFKSHPEVGLVTGHIEYVNQKGQRSGRVIKQVGNHGKVFKDLLLKNRMSMITPVVRREVFDKVGFFNTDFKIFEDWEFWRRVAYYYPFYSLDTVLACVRKHDANTSLIVTNNPLEQYQRYNSLNTALLGWGKDFFTKADLKLIEKQSWKRYKQLLENHCKGLIKKLLFFIQVFTHSLRGGLKLLYLFIKYEIFNR